MWRSVTAVAIGYVTLAVLALIAYVASVVVMEGRLNPGVVPEPTIAFSAVNLVCSFLAAVLGGWACWKLAPVHPIAHIAALAVVVIGVAVVLTQLLQQDLSRLPAWYPYAVTALRVVGVAVGGAIGSWKTTPAVEPGSGLIS